MGVGDLPQRCCPALHPACSSPTTLPHCPQTANQRKELEELREMKEDVERREKAQAEVISQQARPALAAAAGLR